VFVDARQIPDGTRLSAAVCIVGTGPAGLSLARVLSGAGHRVVMLEAGGLTTTAGSQEMAQADSVGAPFLPAHISRRRAFGGTSRWWAGFCRPLDPEVMGPRPWIDHSGWPVSLDALAPYYANAQALLDIAEPVWDPLRWSEGIRGLLAPPEDETPLRPVNLYRAPQRFLGAKYREEFRSSSTVDVLLHAHATAVALNSSGTAVERIKVQTLRTGRHLIVEARAFVLATGGIENARLLLASNDVHNAGIGNGYDLVGRYLMNHPHLAAAWLHLPDNARAGQRARSQRRVPEVQRVALSAARAAAEQIGQFSAYLYPVSQSHHHPWTRSVGYSSLISLLGMNRVAAVQQDPGPLVGAIIKDIPGLLEDVSRKLANRFRNQPYLCAVAETEQVPNRDSRVMLSTRRDPFGQPIAAIDWRLTEQDKRTMRRGIEILDQSFQASGFMPAARESWLLNEDLAHYPGEDWAHHAGTTRMSTDPKQGVVDADCKVHGVGNLYVAGCSVFPTEGMAPPTMTIMALALRLGHHLADRMAALA